jgi:cation diffusion facilitator family transporter
VEATPLVVCGLLCSVLVKLLMSLFYRRANETLRSTAIQAGAADSLSDAALTGVTLLSFGAAGCTAFPVDAAVGLAVAAVILLAGFAAAREALDLLLGKVESTALEQRIREIILGTDGIEGMHGLTVHDYGPCRKYVSAHIELDASMKFADVHALLEQAIDSVHRSLQLDIVLLPEPMDAPRVP